MRRCNATSSLCDHCVTRLASPCAARSKSGWAISRAIEDPHQHRGRIRSQASWVLNGHFEVLALLGFIRRINRHDCRDHPILEWKGSVEVIRLNVGRGSSRSNPATTPLLNLTNIRCAEDYLILVTIDCCPVNASMLRFALSVNESVVNFWTQGLDALKFLHPHCVDGFLPPLPEQIRDSMNDDSRVAASTQVSLVMSRPSSVTRILCPIQNVDMR